jgi:hypothetical protein
MAPIAVEAYNLAFNASDLWHPLTLVLNWPAKLKK